MYKVKIELKEPEINLDQENKEPQEEELIQKKIKKSRKIIYTSYILK